MTRIKMRRRLISISLRTRNSLSDFVGGLLYVVTKRRQRQRRRIDCRVYSDSATSRTPLSMGASFFSSRLLVAERPSLAGGPRWASTCGWYPRIRNFGSIALETMTRIRVFLGSLKFLNFGLLSKLQEPLAGSLPGGPRCREALVAGRPSLLGGPRYRIAGRPSLPGGPRCREVNLSLKGNSCKAFHYCQGHDPRLLRGGPSQGKRLLGSSRYEGPRCQGGPRCRGPRCREALVAGGLRCGGPSLPGSLRRESRCREVNLSLKGSSCKAFHYCQGPDPRLLRGGPSQGKRLLGSSRYEGPRCQGGPRCRGPRCREALVAGGLRCRGPLLTGKLLLPGGLRCRESLVAGRPP